ncbi:MAG: thiamine-monophosphate kinase [Phycisphaerales bacterium]|nr:MAG: thiamine-monophosphate kinase [Phycisphaerales bacterium]
MSAGEDEITAWFARRSRLSTREFPIGIGDDMAQIRLGGESVFITTDMLLDGVHFDLKQATMEQVGYKAMAVSLSDCAAMSTIPVAAVVSVALPKEVDQKELKKLHSGIVRGGDRFGCALVGGDITSWKAKAPFAISVAMLSRKGGNEPVKRSGAKVGDCICVTGSLGGSRAGRHLEFDPRVEEALKITQTVKVHSMIDISDGLSTDLTRLCRASGVGAVVNAEQLPLSQEARKNAEPLSSALNDGEDFELLFTLSQKCCRRLLDAWSGSVPITQIGEITGDGKVRVRMLDGRIRVLRARGYDHLKNS